MRMPRPTLCVDLIVAAPGVAVALILAAMLVVQVASPSWPGEFTLADAAALADQADVLSLLQQKADPNASTQLRFGLLRGDTQQTMTPLEAAAAGTSGNRPAVMKELLDSGAVIDDRTYPVLWCLAEIRPNREVLEFLQSLRPDQPPIACSNVKTPW